MKMTKTPGFDFVPSQDIAAQAALLAVSSFDRAQLKSLCVDDAAYKTTLAQRGSTAAKDVVEVCYAGDYAKALSFIAALGDELALDPVLAPHSTTLKEKAVDRLVAQYCKPYKTVDLARMASAFSLEQDALEDRVARLVGSGQLGDLRVDLVDHALRSSTSSKRDAALRDVLERGNSYLSEVRGLLLRTSCVEHDLVARGRATGPADRGGLRGLDRWGGAPLAAASRAAATRRLRCSTTWRRRRRATTPRGFSDGIAPRRRRRRLGPDAPSSPPLCPVTKAVVFSGR